MKAVIKLRRIAHLSGPHEAGTIEGRTAMDTGRQCALWALVTLLAVTADLQAQQAPPQSPTMTFFITSSRTRKGGDPGGLEGADQHCQTLAQAAGAGSKTWRALSQCTNAAAQGGPVNARDRIGRGPWQNFKGEVIAQKRRRSAQRQQQAHACRRP